MTENLPLDFAPAVVSWQKALGRHHLPWQNTRDPYRVWLSEIMLQQTQVTTVLGYYARFLARFPGVNDLAAAELDEVLGLWSGLGYYSRARNMHLCAQQVVALHAGSFPENAAQLQTLSGIGPSTAAAIAAFCFGERVAILDGNVKRVLARVLAFAGDLAQGAQERVLWGLATRLLPERQDMMPGYTQGVMDLGATICTARKPQCGTCPVRAMCRGFEAGEPEKYPVKTRKLKRSSEQLSLLWAQRPDGSVWLERRPVTGIWGGLYCLPVFTNEDELRAFLPPALHGRVQPLAPFKHVLTHKDLHLAAVMAGFMDGQDMPTGTTSEAGIAATGAWFAPAEWPVLGLPAPIRKLLENEPLL
ncbi:MAG: A/G-specific DNA-adenine glycosylase [Polaromonas sp.]|nr:A/G-specific DNA-adenine glycosylase [Polaromonas sp.]